MNLFEENNQTFGRAADADVYIPCLSWQVLNEISDLFLTLLEFFVTIEIHFLHKFTS